MGLSRRKKMAREAMLKEQSRKRKHEKLFAVKTTQKVFKEYVPKEVYRREVPNYPSFTSQSNAHGTKHERQEYSGDYIQGIATMHKSNLVPVGKNDDPKSYATMRRN